MKSKFLALLTAGVLFAVSSASASVLVAYWAQNDNDLPGGGFGFQPGDFPQAADLGSGFLTVGGGILDQTTVNGNGDTIFEFVPSFSGTTLNAQDGFVSGGSLSIQGGTDTANNGSWWQIEFGMSGLSDAVFSFATRGTSSGFNSRAISYSVDGGSSFVDADTDTGTSTSFYLYSISLGSALNNVDNAIIRVTLDGATGLTGNNRFDNITVSAIPEPSTYAAIFGLLALGLVIWRRRVAR